MFSLSEALNYYLYSSPTDMRKSFNSLSGLVLDKMHRNPQSGDVYIFVNKSRNLIKLLNWQSGGFVIYYKRLEKGSLELPKIPSSEKELQISQTKLMMIISGISIENIRQKKRYN